MASKSKADSLFLEAVVDALPSMVFVKDAKDDFRFKMFNQAGLLLLGQRRENLIGKNDFDFFPEEQAQFFRKKDEEVFNSEGIVDIPEELIDTPSGTRILHTRKIGIKDGNGAPQWLVGISEDITEETLSKRRLDTFVATSRLGFWEWDVQTGRLFWDQRWHEILGYKLGDLEVSSDVFSDLTHPEDRDRVWKEVGKILEGKLHQQEFSFRMRSKSGDWVPILSRCQVAALDAETAKPTIIAGTHLDMSHIIQLQNEARLAEAQLVKSSRLAQIGELTAGVGHEINNPLTVAMGALERLKKGKGDFDKNIEKLTDAHDRIGKIVSSMRSFSRFDESTDSACNPSDALFDTLNFYAELLSHQGINLLSPEKLECVVPIDQAKLGQVFLNVLSNAHDAVKGAGAPEIGIEQKVFSNHYHAVIRDNGKGISAENLDKIFDPFFTTKPAGQGTGIGLGLSKKLIDEAGGRILVESVVGQGTVFRVELPLVGSKPRI